MGIMAREHPPAAEGATPATRNGGNGTAVKRKDENGGGTPSRNKNKPFETLNLAMTDSSIASAGGTDAKNREATFDADRRKGIPHAQGHLSSSQHLDPEDHRRPRKRPYPLHTYPPAQILKILAIENRVKAASLVSSVCSQLALYPMDSIKTRMQVSQFRSVWDCLNYMRHTEGLRMGLYRGIFGPTVSYTFVRMLTFDWYAKMKYNIDDYVENLTGKSILVQVNTIGSKPTLLSTACFTTAGAVTGFTVSFLACPFELLKVGRQMSGMLAVTGEQQAAAAAKGSSSGMVAGAMTAASAGGKAGAAIDEGLSRVYRDKGTFSAGLDLYRRIGIKGLYSGIHLHAIRDTIGTGIFWGSYEGVKQLLSVSRGRAPDDPLAGGVAGGLCGMFAYICSYPIDTVKTVYQQHALFVREGTKHIKASEINWFGREQFRGLPITLARVFISNLIQMWMFEYIKKEIRTLEIDPPPPSRYRRNEEQQQSGKYR